MKTALALLIGAGVLMGCRTMPDAPAGPPALPLSTLWAGYQSYAGKEVVVEGFLIKEGRNHFLLQGTKAQASDEISDGADRISYYCTFRNQPVPLQVYGLPGNDLRDIVDRVKHRPNGYKIEGQKVRVAATVQPVPQGTEGTSEIILPAIVVTSGSIKNARIVAVNSDFCRGDQP